MSFSFTIKKILTKIYDLFGISMHKFRKLNKELNNNYIRIINYHSVSEGSTNNFEKQVKWLLSNFENCDFEKLQLFLNGNYQFKDKPGIIFSFDDGFLDNYTVAYPILKKYNATGWFMISTGLIGTYNNVKKLNYMDKDQLLDLIKNNQVIGCHTYSHHRMNVNDTNEILQKEIIDAKITLEQILNQEIKIFCWVGGEEETYTKEASDIIKKAGYTYSFLTSSYPILPTTNHLQLDRVNVESFWSLSLVKFCISGSMDKRLRKKRIRVHNILE